MILLINFISASAYSQINLVGTNSGAESCRFKYLNLTDGGEKFFALDSGVLVIYNLNLTEYKRINFEPQFENYWDSYIFNISDKLFNNDSKIELLIYHKDSRNVETKIINEDGDVLFRVKDAMPHVDGVLNNSGSINSDIQSIDYIVKTTQGAFLILRYAIEGYGGHIQVYSLPGSSVELQKQNVAQNNLLIVAPNPSNESFTLNIPNEYVSSDKGSLSIFDTSGTLIKSIAIHSSNQQINIASISKGLYNIKYVGADDKELFTKLLIK